MFAGLNTVKCKICRQPTDEFLVTESVPTRILFFTWNGAKVEKLCREHLIQRFREEFTRATHRMVVFHPNLEEKHGDYQYSYVRWNRIMKGLGGDPDRHRQPPLLLLNQAAIVEPNSIQTGG